MDNIQHGLVDDYLSTILPETNIAPENGWLEYYIVSFWDGLFSGAMLVLGSVMSLFGEYCFTSPKTNGWIPKMMGLGKGDFPFKYGHFWYLC